MSRRNTIKVQNFNFLAEAEKQLSSQLERLEQEAMETSIKKEEEQRKKIYGGA